jgi:hypothetical protein
MSPGARLLESRWVSAVPVIALMMMGCLNPFSDCYSGTTLSKLRHENLAVEAQLPKPELVRVADLATEQRAWFEDGWLPMGYASWIGSRVGTDEQALAQAKDVGASVVLLQSHLQGMTTGSIPVTTPTTSTTVMSGTVQSPAGTSNWSGVATTYGTQTTRAQIALPQVLVKSAFLYRPAQSPALGILGDMQAATEAGGDGPRGGLLVDVVIRDSPAATAGVKTGDVLVKVGETDISGSVSQLETINRLAQAWPGRATVSPSLAAAIERHQGRIASLVWYRSGVRMSASASLNAGGAYMRAGPYQGPY